MKQRRVGVVGSCAVLAIALASAPSWSDADPEEEAPAEPASSEEPITGTAVMPRPGSETPFEPFQPYSIGPPEAAWPYNELSGEEKTQIDRDRLQPGLDATNAAFAAAARERSVSAKAEAAAIQLGIDGVEIGVVP